MPELKTLTVQCYREMRVSQKSGKPYQVLVVLFPSGYRFEPFINNEQSFCMSDVPLIGV